MDRTFMNRTLYVAYSVLFAIAYGEAFAQTFLNKPIRLIAGVSAGGASDTIARIVGQKVSEGIGQQILVDNRMGDGGNIAAALCVKAAPDGYTILIVNPALAINAVVRPDLSYDALRDLASVTRLSVSPYVLIVNPSLPAASVRDLIALAKAKPGAINFASSGTGNADHLTGELFKLMAHINIVHVPYKSAVLGVSEVASGQIEMFITGLATVLPLARAGKVRALAVTTMQRSALMPDLPTVAESGLPKYEQVLWGGIFAPARTPKEIIAFLNAEFVKALKTPGVRDQLAAIGAEPRGSTPEEMTELLKREIESFGKLVREIGLKID